MSSNGTSDSTDIDLRSDVGATAGDVAALRELRRAAPSWLSLSVEEIEALIPDGALDQRPPTAASAREFQLP